MGFNRVCDRCVVVGSTVECGRTLPKSQLPCKNWPSFFYILRKCHEWLVPSFFLKNIKKMSRVDLFRRRTYDKLVHALDLWSGPICCRTLATFHFHVHINPFARCRCYIAIIAVWWMEMLADQIIDLKERNVHL